MSKKQEEEIDALVNAIIDLKKQNIELQESIRRCHFIFGMNTPAFLGDVEVKNVDEESKCKATER